MSETGGADRGELAGWWQRERGLVDEPGTCRSAPTLLIQLAGCAAAVAVVAAVLLAVRGGVGPSLDLVGAREAVRRLVPMQPPLDAVPPSPHEHHR